MTRGLFAGILSVAMLGCGGGGRPPHVTEMPNPGDGGTLNVPAFAEFAEVCDSAPTMAGSCLADADCGAGVCQRDDAVAVVDFQAVALTCEALGGGIAAGERCEDSAECARGLCVVAGTCVEPCVVDTDCGVEQRCRSVWARAGEANQEVHGCVARTSVPPDITVSRDVSVMPTLVSSMGILQTGVVGLPGGEGLYLVEPPCGEAALSSRLLTDEEPAEVLFDPVGPIGGLPLNGFAPTQPPMPVLIPNGPDAIVTEAGYLLEFRATTLAPVDVTVLGPLRSGGTLDLDLFYVGATGLSPEGDRGPPVLSAAIDRLEDILANASIAIGEVRQHEVVGILAQRLGAIRADAGDPELAQLFRLSAGAPGPSVAVFLVRELDSFGGILGIAGGIPGPLGMHGTALSGVAVAADVSEGVLAEVLAHEIGHYLGLFHTREISSQDFIYNPLTDVPTKLDCFFINEQGQIDFDRSSACQASLGNLMYPLAAGGSTLTTQQRQVAALAPILAAP